MQETLQWEHELEGFMNVKMAQKPNSPKNEMLSLYENHVALNICQSLNIHKRVLIPVNFYAVTANYDVAGSGHASLLLIEESASSQRYDMHYFETDGKKGGKFNLSDVKEIAGPDRHWSDLIAVERDLEGLSDSQMNSAETGLRFSQFSVTGIEKHKVNPGSILPFLAPLKILDRQFGTLDEVRDTLAVERKMMLDNIFERIASFGNVKILPQQLQFSQIKGECEMASYSALLNYVLKNKENGLLNLTQKLINDLGTDLANSIISRNRGNVSAIIDNASAKIADIEKTMRNGLKPENERKMKKIKELQDEAEKTALPLRNEIKALECAIDGIKKVDSLLKVPIQ